MFIPLHLLLSSAVLLSGADTVKKKAVTPPPDVKAPIDSVASAPRRVALATSPSGPSTVSQAAVATSSTAKRLLGAAIGKSISDVAKAVTPRAAYLSAALAKVGRGPALPSSIRGNPNAVAISADSIVVEKSRHTMTLYKEGTPVRIYFVALGQNPVGPKISRGDNRTPEGLYYIAGHNPDSKYHLSLRVSYPNAQDIVQASARGLATGGDIMIHGLPKGFETVGPEHRKRDWTNGCIAVTNAEIEEIWSAIPDGAVIHIKP